MTAVSEQRRRRRNRLLARSSDRLVFLVSFVLVCLVWELAVRAAAVPLFILPPPSRIGVQLISDLAGGLIFWHLWVTFVEVILGFALAIVLGVVLGSLIGLVRAVERVLYPYILLLQTVPKVAIAPLLIVWLGFGIEPKVVNAALISFFPILVNVIAGLKTVDPQRLLLMRSLRASGWQVFVKLRVPNMLPFLFAGLEVGIIFAVLGAIIGEFLGASEGLGSLILLRQAAIDVAGVLSVLVYLSAMGYVLNFIIRGFGRRFAFWSRNAEVVSI